MRTEAFVVAARRTPVGKAGGALRRVPLGALAAPVLEAVLKDVGALPDDVDDVILGNTAGPGGNPARFAALTAGFGVQIPGVTIDRQCGSGLEAINTAVRMVQAGAGDLYLAGGVESASTAPWKMTRPTSIMGTPEVFARPHFAPPEVGDPDMGVAAENVARAHNISRQRQDQFAYASHRKALAAQAAGRFTGEIVPVTLDRRTPGQQNGAAVFQQDECPRADTSLEKLAALKPVFVPQGTVTAGNSCPINDGAAVVAVVSERKMAELGLSRALRVVDSAVAGVDPNLLGIGPVHAIERLLRRNPEMSLDDVDIIEFTEAFAGQVLACLDTLSITDGKVNVAGGAIALGHPWGASGAILVTRLFAEMVSLPDPNQEAPKQGIATLGMAGGMGIATLLERVSQR